MNKEDFSNEMNSLVGDYNTNYFRYLLYSYNLSPNEGKLIIEEITNDFDGGDVNLIYLIEESFKQKIIDLEKEDKINYLNDLISFESDFYKDNLQEYNLSKKFIQLVYEKIKNEINENNIEYFIIKRNLKDYFYNKKFYGTYMNQLKNIKGKNYDSLIIRKTLKEYNNVSLKDIKYCIHEMEIEILDGENYNNNIRKGFNRKIIQKSEMKKADARTVFDNFLYDYGDSFKVLLEKNDLSWNDGEIIIKEIYDSIYSGELLAEKIDAGFIFRYIKEWK